MTAQLTNSSIRCYSWRWCQMWVWFTSLITELLWSSAGLSALPDPWKATPFVHGSQGAVRAGCSQWGWSWAQRPRREFTLITDKTYLCQQCRSVLLWRERKQQTKKIPTQLQSNSLVRHKVWSLTSCVSLVEWEIMIHVALLLKILHLLFDALILSFT